MGKFSDLLSKLYDVEEPEEEIVDQSYESDSSYDSNYYVEEETPYAGYQETPYVAESEPAAAYQAPVATTTPIPAATVIMLTPYDIRTSQVVCEHIRQGHIVICNLTPNSNNQRVVDYISGAVFALDGKIEPTPVKTTFVCTPKHVELIVDSVSEESGTKVSAL
ncbi:MAG: cell division protein SepF [Clostridiales bacterium]|nr:cell division protein SepF [Clostridiales bacterium]